jgi:hypothetical protein
MPTINKSSAVLVGLERQMALTVCIAVLFLLHKTAKLRESLFTALLVAIVFIDMNAAHRPYQFLLDPGFIYRNPRIIQQPDTEPDRLFYYPPGSNFHPNYVSVLGQPSFAEMSALMFANLLPNTGLFHGFDYFQEIDAFGRLPYARFVDFANQLSPERRLRLLGVLNIKYINSFRPLEGKGVELLRHFAEYPSWLYRIDRVVPRVYVVSRAIIEKDWSKRLERMSSSEFHPLEEVIMEEPLASLQPRRSRGRDTGHAKIVDYKNQRVSIRAALNSPGVLILADSFYPGWRAYVDGRETQILRANLFFRAVVLSPGDHVVEFRYDPASFKIGLAVSLVTLCGLLVVCLWRTRFANRPMRRL